MFKFLLGTIIVLSCGMLGIFKSQTYSRRMRELDALRKMMHLIYIEISYRKDPLPRVFRRMASDNDIASKILNQCSLNMDSGMELTGAWESAVDKICANSCLTLQDRSIIKDFGRQFGKTNLQGQADIFRLLEEKMLMQIQHAADEKNAKGRMYSSLGFFVGIIISVLMI